jgi:glycosyltransferase involved in cell wall biosynthesis
MARSLDQLRDQPLIPEAVMSSHKPSVVHIGKFYPPHRGGMENHVQVLSIALKKSFEITVLVASDDSKTIDHEVDGIRVIRAARLGNFDAAPVCPSMPLILKSIRADIIHIHVPNPTGVLAWFLVHPRGSLIVSYHSDTVRQKFFGALFQPVLDYMMGKSATVIATSPNYLRSSSLLSRHQERCRVIPLSVEPSEFHVYDPTVVTEIRRRFGDRIVLAVGRLTHYKGFEYLIEAMVQVNAQLLIIGTGPLLARLERIAEAYKVRHRVTFLGDVQNLVPYYHAAGLFVLPSVDRSEAFGIVQLEAMACGKPVINTRLSSGVPWVSLDGVTGLTVPPRNPAALAEAINLVLDSENLRAQFGQAARRRVKNEFTRDLMSARILHVYQDALAGKLNCEGKEYQIRGRRFAKGRSFDGRMENKALLTSKD